MANLWPTLVVLELIDLNDVTMLHSLIPISKSDTHTYKISEIEMNFLEDKEKKCYVRLHFLVEYCAERVPMSCLRFVNQIVCRPQCCCLFALKSVALHGLLFVTVAVTVAGFGTVVVAALISNRFSTALLLLLSIATEIEIQFNIKFLILQIKSSNQNHKFTIY